MKIERVNLYHLSMPLRSPFETSFGRSESRDCILLEVFAEGLTGYGECVADRDPGYSYETIKTAWHILGDFLIPTVLRQQIASPADFQQQSSASPSLVVMYTIYRFPLVAAANAKPLLIASDST